jgi:hypothetical protein
MRTDRRTDRHDEANSRFSQFCERALNMVYSRVGECGSLFFFNLDKCMLIKNVILCH